MSLATDRQIATVVQTLLKADLGARKNGGNGAFLATDGLIATVVKMGLGASLLKADLGARKKWGIGARGCNHLFSFVCLPSFTCMPGFQHLKPLVVCSFKSGSAASQGPLR